MLSLSLCLCALLLAPSVSAAPASSISSVASQASASASTIGTASTAVFESSSTPAGTETSSAAESTATVPYASTNPNYVMWGLDNGTPAPIRGSLGASIIGPANVPMEQENPDLFAPPTTDAGTVGNAKWPFALSHNRLQTGGWARQENVDVFPIATSMAAVNMRLEAGAIRELHWHLTSEWAYVLKGTTQVTAVDSQGRNFVGNVGPGDLWYFPPGIPHSLQATNDSADGSEFLLVFDNGDFSEDATFLLTDWLSHVPMEVIEKNFKATAADFSEIPAQQLYIFPAAAPANTDPVSDPQGQVPDSFTYALSQVNNTPSAAGTVKIADSTTFTVATTIAAAEVTVPPGSIRELHWHPTMDEWSFFIEGEARVTIFAAQGNARTFNFQPGDIGFVPTAMGHYVENTGNTTLKYLEIFNTDKYQDVSLNQWLALTPPALVKAHLGLSDETIASLSKTKNIVI